MSIIVLRVGGATIFFKNLYITDTRDLDCAILQRTLDFVDAAIHEADLRATKAQRFNLVAKAYPFVAEQPERARELLRSALDLAKETK